MSGSFDYSAHSLLPSFTRPALPGGPQTIAAILDPVLETEPEREALVGRFARYSYGELDREVNRAAHALESLGIHDGDRVAASMANQAELVVMFMATMRLGAIWVGINRQLAPPEKAYILNDSGVSLFMGADDMVEQVQGQSGQIPLLKHVLRAEPGDLESDWARLLSHTRDTSRPEAEIDPVAPAAIA